MSTSLTEGDTSATLRYRNPTPDDGAAIHALVDECKPLDLNSLYCYLLVTEHFSRTSVVVDDAEGIGGFISAYIPPGKPDTVFVWQVAVSPRMRGRGLAKKMLQFIVSQEPCEKVRFLETTVSPGNVPSKKLFESLARDLGAPIEERVLFAERHFGTESHESEVLHRIGPFNPQTKQTSQE